MTIKLHLALPFLLLLHQPLLAQDLRLPFAVLAQHAEAAVFDSYDMPLGPWTKEGFPRERREGMIDRRAWHLDAPRASLVEILAPLRQQLQDEGYEVVFECESRDCGGFDFRFATEVMAEPAMYVDLGHYRYLAAKRGDEALSLLVSRSAEMAYVQMIHIGAKALGDAPKAQRAPIAPLPKPPAGALATKLDAGLSAPIEGLVFSSNSRTIEGDTSDLAALADWLKAHPERKIVLIGHSDISGSLAGNITVSKQRAEALRQSLIKDYGIAAARLSAEGIGPLSPRAPHGAEESIALNRRIEALALP